MARKVGKVALVVTIAIVLVVGYLLNFIGMLARVGPSEEIIILSFMLGYAVVYLSCWLIVLFIAYKRNSKKLLNLFFIFWLIKAACLFLNSFFGELTVLGVELAFLGWLGFLLFVPLAGLDALRFYVSNGYLYAYNMHVALMVSAIMLLLGVVAKLKRKASV